MPHDLTPDITPSDSTLQQLLERLRRAGAESASLLSLAQDHLSPQLERLADWLTSPENVATLQQGFIKMANQGISLGFKADPASALLFEFASWLEEETDRAQVAARVLSHNPLDDGTLLLLLKSSLATPPDASPQSDDPEVLKVRTHLTHMLCALAQLEEETPLPDADDLPALQSYLERAILPERFSLLPRLAAGDPEAFEALATLHQKESDTKETDPSLTQRLTRRVTTHLKEQVKERVAEASASSLIPRPRQRSPALSFLTTSYLFFLQSYLTRALIEHFPQAVAQIRVLERAERAERDTAPDAPHIDVLSTDTSSSSRTP